MANQTYRLVVTGNAAGQFVQNIFHYRLDDGGFADRLLAAKGLIEGWIAATMHEFWLAMCPDAYILKSVKARRITNGGGPEYVDVSLNGQTGSAGADLQCSANGPVIIWNTEGGARRVGKTFVPGISNANIKTGEITEAFLAELISQADDYRAAFAVVGGGAVLAVLVIPRSNDPATRSTINMVQVSKYLGKQRRRQLPV